MPLQTGSSLVIIIGTFYVPLNTKEGVWIEAKTYPMMKFQRVSSCNRFPRGENSRRFFMLWNLFEKIIFWKIKNFIPIWIELASWFIASLQEHPGVPFLLTVTIFSRWRKPVLHVRFKFLESTKSRERCRLRFWRHRLCESRGLVAISEAKLCRSRVVKYLDMFWHCRTKHLIKTFYATPTISLLQPATRLICHAKQGSNWGYPYGSRKCFIHVATKTKRNPISGYNTYWCCYHHLHLGVMILPKCLQELELEECEPVSYTHLTLPTKRIV